MNPPTTTPGSMAEFDRALRLVNLTANRLASAFATANGLHISDFRALGFIYEAELTGEPLSSSTLAKELGLSSAAITYLVERLVSTGHVFRDCDPNDRRRVILRQAPDGQNVAQAYFDPFRDRLARAVGYYSPHEVETATRILRDVAEAMQDYGRSIVDAAPAASPTSPSPAS